MHLYYERQGGKGRRFYWLGWREVIPELERMRWQVLLRWGYIGGVTQSHSLWFRDQEDALSKVQTLHQLRLRHSYVRKVNPSLLQQTFEFLQLSDLQQLELFPEFDAA